MGVPVTDGQAATLARFEALLLNRAVDLGLVAEGDRNRIRERHLLDCLRAATTVVPTDREACDLGSGAGLPGVVVAVVRPAVHVVLIEARVRRVAFLELAVAELRLSNVAVRHGRIEEMKDLADLCFARAFAPLEESWRAARRLLRPGGRLVYFAGARGVARGIETPLVGASACLVLEPVLESSGRLVIMTRQ
jgi:16S rRNA (guanine527-N7)-methyltransferase